MHPSYLWRTVERELNACVRLRIMGAGSGDHLLFRGGIGVAGFDRLSEPSTCAHDAVVRRLLAFLQVDVYHARPVLGLAAEVEDPHERRGYRGADDGNRTRMTSLEGVLHLAVRAAELGGSLSGSDRDWPLFTGVNGPLMARAGRAFCLYPGGLPGDSRSNWAALGP